MKTSQHLLLAAIAGLSLCTSPSITRADALDVWLARNSGAVNILNADAYGNGIYVAVGNEGTILTSTNGLTWTRRTSGTTLILNSMVFANNRFVVVGESGTILTSTNGTSWTPRISGTTQFLYDVSYGRGVFIAVTAGGIVLTSTNGANWTTSTTGGPLRVYGVAYGNGKFVSVGGVTICIFWNCDNHTVISSSNDGVTWDGATIDGNPNSTAFLSDLAFGNGTFVAVGEAGTIFSSTNGVNWTQRNTGSSDYLLNVAFGDGTFVVVGADQGTILTSTNGVTWTPRNSGTSLGLYNVAHGNGTFLAVGNGGTILQSRYIGPPILRAPRFLANGSFTIPVTGPVERNYRLQWTTNLAAPAWVNLPVFTQTAPTQAVVNPGVAGSSSRFYRVVPSP